MVRSKPAKLLNQSPEKRSEERTAVTVAGRCRAGDRDVQQVFVTDLGPRGCCLLGLSAGVTKSDLLELWIAESGPFAARFKSVKRGLLGVEFDEPLDDHLLESLANAAREPKVVPLRRSRTD